MITEIILPKNEANIYEVTIGKWLKLEGEHVITGTPIVEIITDKAVFELESSASGILKKIVIPEKSNVLPGMILCIIGEENDKIPADIESRNNRIIEQFYESMKNVIPAENEDSNNDPGTEEKDSISTDKTLLITPAAKRLLKEKHIDWEKVKKFMVKDLETSRTITLKILEKYLKKF